MQIDGDVDLPRAELSGQAQVLEPAPPAPPMTNDERLVDVRIVGHDRRGQCFDEIQQFGVGESPPQRLNGWSGQNDVADQARPNQQNRHSRQSSTLASSTSITGMSSLIG